MNRVFSIYPNMVFLIFSTRCSSSPKPKPSYITPNPNIQGTDTLIPRQDMKIPFFTCFSSPTRKQNKNGTQHNWYKRKFENFGFRLLSLMFFLPLQTTQRKRSTTGASVCSPTANWNWPREISIPRRRSEKVASALSIRLIIHSLISFFWKVCFLINWGIKMQCDFIEN